MPTSMGLNEITLGASTSTANLGGAQLATTAMNLAQTRQNMRLQQQQVEVMKEQLETAKFNKTMTRMQLLARTRPEIAKRMVPKIKSDLAAAGIPVDDGILEMLASDEDYKRRFQLVGSMLSGQITDPEIRQQALQAFTDLGAFDAGLSALHDQYKLKMQAQTQQSRLATEERRATQFIANEMNKVRNDYNKVVDPLVTTFGQLNQAKLALRSGKISRIKAAIPVFARTINQEKGPLSDNDTARVLAENISQKWGELQNWITSNPSAKLPKGQLEDLWNMVTEYERVARGAVEAQLAQRAQSYADHPMPEIYAYAQNLTKQKLDLLQQLGTSVDSANLTPKQKQFIEQAKKLINPATGKPYTNEEIMAKALEIK